MLFDLMIGTVKRKKEENEHKTRSSWPRLWEATNHFTRLRCKTRDHERFVCVDRWDCLPKVGQYN